MDVMRTPPHSTNPVTYFGETAFLWAPKKPRQYQKPPLRSGRKPSSRSLDFSAILVQEDDNEKSNLLESYERRQAHIRSRRSRHETPVFVRNIDSPASNHGSPLAFENTIARRIDFASQSFTSGQERVADTSDSPSVFSPGLSPAAKGILSQLKRESIKRSLPATEKRSTSRTSEHQTPDSSSPHKRGKWTRLVR